MSVKQSLLLLLLLQHGVVLPVCEALTANKFNVQYVTYISALMVFNIFQHFSESKVASALFVLLTLKTIYILQSYE